MSFPVRKLRAEVYQVERNGITETWDFYGEGRYLEISSKADPFSVLRNLPSESKILIKEVQQKLESGMIDQATIEQIRFYRASTTSGS